MKKLEEGVVLYHVGADLPSLALGVWDRFLSWDQPWYVLHSHLLRDKRTNSSF